MARALITFIADFLSSPANLFSLFIDFTPPLKKNPRKESKIPSFYDSRRKVTGGRTFKVNKKGKLGK
jgi:hypothetical protein